MDLLTPGKLQAARVAAFTKAEALGKDTLGQFRLQKAKGTAKDAATPVAALVASDGSDVDAEDEGSEEDIQG